MPTLFSQHDNESPAFTLLSAREWMNIDRNPEVCAHTTVDKDTYFHEMSIYSASRGSAHEDYDRDDYFANRYGLGFKTWMGDDEGLYKLADGNADYDAQYNDNRGLKYSPTFSFRHATSWVD